MLRIIAGRILDIIVLCVCYINWQKTLGRVNWTTVMQTLKGNGNDLRGKKD
jgi:hypothetical protein